MKSEKNLISVKIRQYRPDDKEKVHSINHISLEISFRYFYDVFHEKEPELFLVAEYKGEIVGFILVKNGMNLGESSTALIYAIAVSPQYRSLGIGTQLVKAIMKVLQEKHIKKFFLHVRTANKRAVKFYERLGFTEIKKIEKFYSWGEDAYRMMKLIE
ncbi:MAG: GNAT family N-acetyltransferase [Candidatus Helarchaeota archaeon]|nr:GNAT family N-acetyltransferase [Candidatus Helarchaeota archaeon]